MSFEESKKVSTGVFSVDDVAYNFPNIDTSSLPVLGVLFYT